MIRDSADTLRAAFETRMSEMRLVPHAIMPGYWQVLTGNERQTYKSRQEAVDAMASAAWQAVARAADAFWTPIERIVDAPHVGQQSVVSVELLILFHNDDSFRLDASYTFDWDGKKYLGCRPMIQDDFVVFDLMKAKEVLIDVPDPVERGSQEAT